MYLRDLQDEDFEVAIKVELLLISKLVEVFNGTNRSDNPDTLCPKVCKKWFGQRSYTFLPF